MLQINIFHNVFGLLLFNVVVDGRDFLRFCRDLKRDDLGRMGYSICLIFALKLNIKSYKCFNIINKC